MARRRRRGRPPGKRPIHPRRLAILTLAAEQGWRLARIARALRLTKQRADQLLIETRLHARWRATCRRLAPEMPRVARRYFTSTRGRHLLDVRDHLAAAGYRVTLEIRYPNGHHMNPPRLRCGRRRVRLLFPAAIFYPTATETACYYHSSIACREAIYAVVVPDGRTLVYFPPYRCGPTLYIPAGPRLPRGVARRMLPRLEWHGDDQRRRKAA